MTASLLSQYCIAISGTKSILKQQPSKSIVTDHEIT